MSMIVPAGKNRMEWAPIEGLLVKTASTGAKEVKDDLLTAAKKVIAEMECKSDEAFEKKEECPECTDKPVVEEIEVSIEDDPKAELEKAEADGVVTENEEEAIEETVEEKVEGAVEEIEVILEEVKEAIGVQEEAHAEEVAFEPEADKTEFVADKAEEAVEDKGDSKENFNFAGSEEEFCRYAKISPKNKAKLNDYWKNVLGFPSDWVDLLTK